MEKAEEHLEIPGKEATLMDLLGEESLRDAQGEGRFQPQKAQYILIESDGASSSEHADSKQPSRVRRKTLHLSGDLLGGKPLPRTISPPQQDRDEKQATFRCLFQSTRPHHVSGQPDHFPFKDPEAVKQVFDDLDLPRTYLQIADGSLGLASASIYSLNNQPRTVKYELIVYCIARHGDWAIALSHDALQRTTSIFWNMDHRLDSSSLLSELESLERYACHPMLVPCIMFSATLREGVKRRHAIKARMARLEDTIRNISLKASQISHDDFEAYQELFEQPRSVEDLFDLLNTCRREQSSREGRYDFWRSLHAAIGQGFEYAEQSVLSEDSTQMAKAHVELKQWAALTWQKFESLKARDMDHVARVDNVSDMLFHLVSQRDSRIHSTIAKASQRDNEDMKFIALLGSIFLPASLVASILNVQVFQFAPGPQLFGAYIAITVPLIGVVVAAAMARRRMTLKRLWPQPKKKQSEKHPSPNQRTWTLDTRASV